MTYLTFKSHTSLSCLLQSAPAKMKILFTEVSREDKADLQVLIPVILCFYAKAYFCCLNRFEEMLV